MANPFRTRNVPDSIVREIKARVDDTKLIKWTGKRFPWIYVLSCASTNVCSEKYNELGNDPDVASQSLSLFGDNTSLAAYDTNTKMPLPYVDGLDVKAMGSLGTTRKATVSIKAYTDEQLIQLQKCFFIPGMDIRVQWGWNEDCNGNLPPTVLKDRTIPSNLAICRINKLRKQYSNYDGFQGIVANFKYKLSRENVWECEIEVISAADPFSSSKVSNDGCPCTREVETDQGETKQSNGPIYAMLTDIYNDGSSAARRLMRELRSKTGYSSSHRFWASWEMEGVERTETGGEKDGSWFDGVFGGEETEEYFISFGAFVDMLNSFSIPHDKDDPDATYPYGRVDINNVVLPYPRYMAAADVRICYIQNGDIDVEDIFNENEEGTDYVDARIGGGIQLARIMCNVIELTKQYKQVFDGDQKLKTLIDNVLNSINQTCGSPWTFVTVSTEEDCEGGNVDGPTITILDERQQMEKSTPFNLPALPGGSVLRDFGLNLKMTGAMKTQALYAGNGQKSGGGNGKDASGCEGVAVAPFYSGNQIENLAKPKPNTTKVDCGNCDEGSKSVEEPTEEEILENMRDGEINDSTTSAFLTYIRKQLKDEDKKSCAGVPLPFDLSFELDGISGFEFGQMVTSDRIPAEIRKSFRWQVTKVEHSLSGNEWKTKVSTVARANPFGDKGGLGKTRV